MVKGIVCTLGPSCYNLIGDLKNSGVAIFRINGSFGIPYIRIIDELKEKNIPILVDLPGSRTKNKHMYVTDEDLIQFAINNKLDYVGLSYVKNAEEVRKLKDVLNPFNIKVIAKIENKEGFENRMEIIKEADKILIDRGDLGTSIGFENVPRHQIEILKSCNMLNKEVIVATEMMMSTLNSTKPNCADVSDVYFAVHHGADYVMLSEETAIGKNPLETVKIMKKIIDTLQ